MLNMLRFISNDLEASLVCFGVMEAREAIQGDVQLARRFDVLTMPRWSADEAFEELVRAILRNQPMRERSVLTAKALRHIFLTTDGITARIFRMMNAFGDCRDRKRARENHRRRRLGLEASGQR